MMLAPPLHPRYGSQLCNLISKQKKEEREEEEENSKEKKRFFFASHVWVVNPNLPFPSLPQSLPHRWLQSNFASEIHLGTASRNYQVPGHPGVGCWYREFFRSCYNQTCPPFFWLLFASRTFTAGMPSTFDMPDGFLLQSNIH
jgi:hypothetical protein